MDIKNALRWIAVLPATFVGSVVVFLLGKLFAWFAVNKFFILSSGNSEDSWISIIITAIANYVAGAGGIAAGAFVAPNHKYVTSIVLTVALLCVCCLSVGIESVLGEFRWFQYLYMALMLAGAISGVMQVKEDERSKTEEKNERN